MTETELSAEGGIPLIEPLSRSTSPLSSSSRKRKADTISGNGNKPKQHKRQKKPKKALQTTRNEDEDFDEEMSINRAIGRMDPQSISELVSRKTNRFLGEQLSAVELEELLVPPESIADTTRWNQPRTLESLPNFLSEFTDYDLKASTKKPGKPHTIVISASGIRAADLTRALRGFQTKETKITKLFAKHIKLKEAVDTCKRTRMSIGVGTPQRILDLLDSSALNTENLKSIVIDASSIDVKRRGALDMRDLVEPLVRLLAKDAIRDQLSSIGSPGKTRVLFY